MTGLAIQGEDWSLAPVHPEFIARERCGAWIDPAGRIFPVVHGTHDLVAQRLRAAGFGPDRDWTIARPWLWLKDTGCVHGFQVTRAQWSALTDVAFCVRGTFGENIVESLRASRAIVASMPGRFGDGHVEGVTRLIRPAHEGD